MKDQLKNAIAQFHNDESGATATEYVILLVLVACFVIGIVKVFGNTLSAKVDTANTAVMNELTF